MKKTFKFKKLALATAVGSLMAAGGAQASTVGYSMWDVYSGNSQHVADLPVNDLTAGINLTNHPTPNAWLTSGGTPVTVNYGWAQGGGLPATWHVDLGAADTAAVNAADFRAARIAGGFDPDQDIYLDGNGDPIQPPQPNSLVLGAKAYLDGSNAPSYTNWGHNSDFGLLTLSSTANVTIQLSGITSASGQLAGSGVTGLRPGFAVWQGWDTNGGTRHTTWDENGAPFLNAGAPSPFNPPAPSMTLGGANRNVDSLGAFMGTAWSSANNGTATLTLNNLSAGNYYIAMGGYCGPANGTGSLVCGASTTHQYKVAFTSTASAVPLPAAAWLFGPALAGLGAIGRRKGKTA